VAKSPAKTDRPGQWHFRVAIMARWPKSLPMQYWLLKSEPDEFSIDDLQARGEAGEPWDGVRNYQARNYMRDAMRVGERALFYHSNCPEIGAVGVMEVAAAAIPDPTAWDPQNKHFDPKSDPDNPRWMMVTVRFLEKFPRTVTLAEIKADPMLSGMQVAQRGNRLSITPVTKDEFDHICQLARSA